MEILDMNAPTALYYQLKQIVIKKIKSGEWPDNSRLPAELDLAAQYNISRATVRQALKELETEGYLYRKQGKGTFVTIPKIEQKLNKFYSFSEEIEKMGYTPSTQLLDFCEVAPDQDVREQMNLSDQAKVYCIKRLRLASNLPFALESSYVPCEICPGMKREDIEQHGLYATMRDIFNASPNAMEETIEAIILKADEAKLLHMARNSAGLYLTRIAYANDQIVEYCKTIVNGNRYKYRVHLRT